MRQSIKVAAGLALCVLLAGCDGSEQKLQQAEKSLDSWDATLALVQRQWAEERIPPKYVRQLADDAATSLELRDRAQQLRDAAGAGRRAP